ncbi:RpiR family transcriptional regulator, partial [Streptomyces sp. NPDC058734]
MSCINRRDLALLALRAGTGAVLMAHGTQKLFGWFGGGGGGQKPPPPAAKRRR